MRFTPVLMCSSCLPLRTRAGKCEYGGANSTDMGNYTEMTGKYTLEHIIIRVLTVTKSTSVYIY